ncbi:putative short-chain dehydrogenases/reductase [Hypomontagnella submonticulosa]|nr:putative short-chain dehydrogenases/reductase [Hypomontagnella submonticulosa]
MVSLSQVIASNQRIASTFPPGLVAVFVGGTSGVGEYTVKAFAKYVSKPKVYIVGRSQEAADRIVGECKKLNPGGTFEFIKADVSLLKGVDDVCRQLKSKETAINLLFESQGGMGFAKTTSEGLPLASSLVIHSRLRFVLNLLPLLQNASSLRRVVNVQAATSEGSIDLNNICGQGFPLFKWRNQVASVQTLLLEEVTRRAPDVSFIHNIPGIVKGGISRDAEGLGMYMLIGITNLILFPLFETRPDECGERHMFLATSARYVPREDKANAAGVPLDGTLPVARGTDGQTGSGMYSIGMKGESAPKRVETLLAQFREDGTAEKVWDYIMKDFKRITGTEVAA